MKLIITRHAESTANKDGILAGRIPAISLSDEGRVQASKLADVFKNIEIHRAFSSPIQRCLETAEISLSGKRPDNLMDEFIEMDYGRWSGQKLSDLNQDPMWRDVQLDPANFTFPQGESFLELRLRIQKGITKLTNQCESNDVVVLFTHADVIKMILSQLLDSPINKFQAIQISPASITLIEIEPEKLSIAGVNIMFDINTVSRWIKNAD